MTASEMSLLARLGVDITAFENGLKRASSFAGEQFKAMAGMFAAQFSISNIVGEFQKSLTYANTMRDNAEATGVSVEHLQTLGIAAEQAGSSAEKLQMAMMKIGVAQGAIASSADEGGKLAAAFEKFGISSDQAITMDKARILEAIGAKMAEGKDAQQLFNAASDIFGERIGPNFLQALKDIGAQGLDPLTEKLKQSGAIMNEELAKQLDEAKKSLERFEQMKTVGSGKGLAGMMDLAALVALWAAPDSDFSQNYYQQHKNDKEVRIKRRFNERKQAQAEGGVTNFDDATLMDLAREDIESAERSSKARQAAEAKDAALKSAKQSADKQNGSAAQKIEDEIADKQEKRHFSELSILEKIRDANDKIRKIQELRAMLKPGENSGDKLYDAQLHRQQSDLEGESAAAQRQRDKITSDRDREIADAKAGKGISVSPIQAADRLARIGGYVGGQTDPMVRSAERAIKIQEKIAEILERVENKLGEGGVTE